VHAVDYLLKPFDRERFRRHWRRALEQVRNREGGGHPTAGGVLAGLKPAAAARSACGE